VKQNLPNSHIGLFNFCSYNKTGKCQCNIPATWEGDMHEKKKFSEIPVTEKNKVHGERIY